MFLVLISECIHTKRLLNLECHCNAETDNIVEGKTKKKQKPLKNATRYILSCLPTPKAPNARSQKTARIPTGKVTHTPQAPRTSVSHLTPPHTLTPPLIRAPVLSRLSELPLLHLFRIQLPDPARALLVARRHLEFERERLGDEQDGVVESGVRGFLGDVAPFEGLVGWREGPRGAHEVKACFFGKGVGGLEAGVELFVGDGSFSADAGEVGGFLGDGGFGFRLRVLLLLGDVEEPGDGSDADEHVFVGDGLALA